MVFGEVSDKFWAYVDAPQRHTILAIQQVIMLAELAVNRVLDNVDIPKPAPHS